MVLDMLQVPIKYYILNIISGENTQQGWNRPWAILESSVIALHQPQSSGLQKLNLSWSANKMLWLEQFHESCIVFWRPTTLNSISKTQESFSCTRCDIGNMNGRLSILLSYPWPLDWAHFLEPEDSSTSWDCIVQEWYVRPQPKFSVDLMYHFIFLI